MPRLLRTTLTLLLASVLFVGCDSGEDEDDGTLGRWASTENSEFTATYLEIADDELIRHQFINFGSPDPDFEGCFISDTSEVVDREGDEWTLRDENGEVRVRSVRRVGDDLLIEDPRPSGPDPGTPELFERSTRTSFVPVCDGF